MQYDYNQLLTTARKRLSTINRSNASEQFYSDRSRVIYNSSFRRLQQKAQVFSLEPNASVRTRLTHSLEVSDLGRTLANKIAQELCSKGLLSAENISSFIAVVENACLLHDIGNPPFGHFGESAIRDWAQKRALNALPTDMCKSDTLKKLLSDFEEFDGNPQGFRIVTKLYTDYDQYSLNLTYATLLSILKYSRAAGEEPVKGKAILKKAGYFQSELPLVKEIYQSVGLELHHRYPLTYIMEAADDIAYCMSDISDGIEKGILTEEKFLKEFQKHLDITSVASKSLHKKLSPTNDCLLFSITEGTLDQHIDNLNGFNRDISVPWSRAAVQEAVENYFSQHDMVYNGVADSLLSEDSGMGMILETMKTVSSKLLYNSSEAENIELTGYAVISGILEKYELLLKLPFDVFEALIDKPSQLKSNDCLKEKIKSQKINIDMARRLYHRIGDRYVNAYRNELKALITENASHFEEIEWWLRVHLLIDHIDGMTDEYALQTYQMLTGIQLMRS